MSDYGDFCREMREHRRKVKDNWRGGGMKDEIKKAHALAETVSEFSPEHLRLEIKSDRGLRHFDFWPSTKRWNEVGGKAYGFGIDKLKSYLRIN